MAGQKPFSGQGLDSDPFTPEELSQHREMFREVSKAWTTISNLDDMVRGGRSLKKIIGGMIVIGGIVAYVAEKGWFL